MSVVDNNVDVVVLILGFVMMLLMMMMLMAMMVVLFVSYIHVVVGVWLLVSMPVMRVHFVIMVL